MNTKEEMDHRIDLIRGYIRDNDDEFKALFKKHYIMEWYNFLAHAYTLDINNNTINKTDVEKFVNLLHWLNLDGREKPLFMKEYDHFIEGELIQKKFIEHMNKITAVVEKAVFMSLPSAALEEFTTQTNEYNETPVKTSCLGNSTCLVM